jgi:hypothetical protein
MLPFGRGIPPAVGESDPPGFDDQNKKKEVDPKVTTRVQGRGDIQGGE